MMPYFFLFLKKKKLVYKFKFLDAPILQNNQDHSSIYEGSIVRMTTDEGFLYDCQVPSPNSSFTDEVKIGKNTAGRRDRKWLLIS